jgi:flagellar biosynthesis/type III secretory pathway M-ring protein FliF/YscJ
VLAGVGAGGGGGAPPAADGDSIRQQVEQLVDTNPDRVAQQLRSWMQED